ncbi:Forkhead-associated [Sterolibacterium denitrificans]|uniref:Uncharacterized protein n=2 Tax=Sterolibacterium denitrificans TaxID=157592 RepID=A0A656Z9X7_9PROT|nr:FHA domain-containing protein [Sterolibacterium denitrificans]KYC29365.1 hypothetical protein ACY05_02245 [Sterolibacterium denitrificans]SMB31084.1 Forkhead-associated [Sterolibacterium denitrificans]
MEKIVVSLEGMVLREVPLTRERTTIGRKPHNDIQIDNLAISGEHAVIVRQQQDACACIEDLGSTNGTQVNGLPVKRHLLQHGDVINLGKYRLTYLRAADAAEAQRTPTPAPVRDAIPPAALQILSGASAGKELALSKNLCTLGKPGVQVAAIARRPQGYFITHVEGESFPAINGSMLDAQAHLLNDHDIIELAGVKMEFFFKA